MTPADKNLEKVNLVLRFMWWFVMHLFSVIPAAWGVPAKATAIVGVIVILGGFTAFNFATDWLDEAKFWGIVVCVVFILVFGVSFMAFLAHEASQAELAALKLKGLEFDGFHTVELTLTNCIAIRNTSSVRSIEEAFVDLELLIPTPTNMQVVHLRQHHEGRLTIGPGQLAYFEFLKPYGGTKKKVVAVPGSPDLYIDKGETKAVILIGGQDSPAQKIDVAIKVEPDGKVELLWI